MTRWLTRLAGCALTIGLVVNGAAGEEKPPVKTDLFPALFQNLDNDADVQRLWRSCPADIYRAKASFWTNFFDNPDVEVSACEADPAGCYDQCFQAANEEACFALARTFQDNADEKQSRHSEAMFAQACAAGSAGGCTNRGGGIRNGGYADDPFSAMPEAERNGCLFRTFDVSCGAGDAWGCTMLGQAYQYGQGIAKSVVDAEQSYRKACEIDPDFDACDYAKSQIESLQ